MKHGETFYGPLAALNVSYIVIKNIHNCSTWTIIKGSRLIFEVYELSETPNTQQSHSGDIYVNLCSFKNSRDTGIK